MLARKDAVGFKAVSKVRGEGHKVEACLMKATIYDLDRCQT